MGYSIAYNSGSTTPFGTYKQGNILMGLKPQEYTVSSGFIWYANAETLNGNYLIISDTYSQGWSTQAESKPTIWRSETGTTESFVALVNQLPDVNGVTGFTDSGTAMKYLMDLGKYFVNKDDYLGIVTDGLILNLDAGWYPSYSGSGTTWKDLKGSNNGTLTNGPTFSSADGGGIVFDGVDDYSKTAILSGMTTSIAEGSITYEYWLKPEDIIYGSYSQSTSGTAFYRPNGATKQGLQSNASYLYTCNRNDDEFSSKCALIFALGTNGFVVGLHQCNYAPTILVDYKTINGINHLVVIKETNSVSYYLNGIFQKNSLTVNRDIGDSFGDNSLNRVGVITDSGGNSMVSAQSSFTTYFKGDIYSYRVYFKKLSNSEITQNYNAQKGRFGL